MMAKYGFFCVLIFFASSTKALEITDYEISRSSSSVVFSVVFSGSFKIKGIVSEGSKLILPADEYRGKKYENVKVLSKKTYLALKKIAASAGSFQTAKNFKNPVFKISSVRKLKSSGRIANVILKADDDLFLTAGVIKNNSGEFWVAYPSCLEFLDKKGKRELDSLILESYKKSK